MADLPTGAAIREARKQQGLTMQVVADRSGFTPQYVCHIERGVNQPSVENFVRLPRARARRLAHQQNLALRVDRTQGR
jgi:transcriptional regulator with XRE-family HTH domain